jgi:hypothetical protein
MFIPFDKLTFLAAATLLARAAGRGLVTATHEDLIRESQELLGRLCATGVILAHGIVTVPWEVECWETGLGYLKRSNETGSDVELPPDVWRRPEARRCMVEPPLEGRWPGEMNYGGGRVLVVFNKKQIIGYAAFLYDVDPADLATHDSHDDRNCNAHPTKPTLPDERDPPLSTRKTATSAATDQGRERAQVDIPSLFGIDPMARANSTSSVLTKAEAAAKARIHVRSLERRLENGTGPRVTRIGRRVLIREDHLAEWLDLCASAAKQTAA